MGGPSNWQIGGPHTADAKRRVVRLPTKLHIRAMLWLALLLFWQLPNLSWLYYRVHERPFVLVTDKALQIRLDEKWSPSISNLVSWSRDETNRVIAFIPMNWLSPWRFTDYIQMAWAESDCHEKDVSRIRGLTRETAIAKQIGYEIETSAGDKATRVLVPKLCVVVSASEKTLLANIVELAPAAAQ